MASIRDFLSRGYFPLGIPQSFESKSFGAAVATRGVSLPAQFFPNANGKFSNTAHLAKHNLARGGQLRRPLSIPNPVMQFNLVRETVGGATPLATHFSSDSISITSPITDPDRERAVVARVAHPERASYIAQMRSAGRYVLCVDVQQFYPSIYTHSLAWALHGKKQAKAQRNDMALLGNRLDFWVRRAQDQQTRGIPIGPDTSLVLGEILMAAVDAELQRQLGKLRGFRAVDDFELVFPTLSKAESALTVFQGILEAFELKVNEEKTRIVELPVRFEDLWPMQLRQCQIRRTPMRQGRDILDFFNLAFELAQNNPKASVLRYAISRVRSLTVADQNWPAYQNLLLQCAHSEPGTLPHVTAEFLRYRAEGANVDEERVADLVSQLTDRHLTLGEGSEVAWALWLSLKMGVPLEASVTAALPGTSDCLIPLLALWARSRKMTKGTLDVSGWSGLMKEEELWGENWLLSYEANVKGWLPSAGSTDHVARDPCFSFLKNNGVEFFNARASAYKVKRWRPRLSATSITMSPG